MEYPNNHARERDELAKVDYFLDQLARAVERGEVPMASYEALSPRYLERRADLVAILTAALGGAMPAGQPAQGNAAGTPVAAQGWAPDSQATAMGQVVPAATTSGYRAPAPAQKAPPKPVDWTTVLLFLGAFLVIAASAIFAVTVWDIAGPTAKLTFMGALTVVFYAAGYFARTKLHLKAGSAALTVVGSAMLLFDSWIAISGFGLEGPFPWAVALFVISAVYWFTEVRLGDRFYGLAGAAAQVGWWWLMATGLHLEVPVRLAGIAVVALLWQVLAERARADASWGSLARMLLWAAPLVELGAALGIAYDALLIGSPTWTLVGSALAAAASGGIVAWRSYLIGRGRAWVAAAAQVPFFIVLFLPSDASWLGVALLVTMTIIYALFALFRAGAPFTIAALVTEVLAAGSVGSLLKLDDQVMVGVLAVLALTWVIASRLAGIEGLARRGPTLEGLGGFVETTWVGGLLLLAAASVLSLAEGAGVPLTGPRIPAADVTLYAVVLACWAAASLAKRGPLFASATTAWSFVSLVALVAWAAPVAHSTEYALSLLLLAAVWLAIRVPMERFYCIDRLIFGWTMRVVALWVVVAGLVAELVFYNTVSSLHGVVLALGGALVFAGDAALKGPQVSASVAGVLGVFSAYLAGDRPGGIEGREIVCAAGAALVLSTAGAGLRVLKARQAPWLAVAAAATGTIACATGTLGQWPLAAALVITVLAWVAAGFAAREPRLSVAAGLAGFAAVTATVATVNPGSWVTIIVLGAAGMLLGMTAMVVPQAGPDGSHSGLGAGLSIAGLAGLGWLAWFGWLSGKLYQPMGRWFAITEQGVVVCLLLLGAYVVVQAMLWRIEPGLYVGYGVFLLAAFAEFRVTEGAVAEWYSTAIGIYLIAMGYLYASREDSRAVPVGIDLAAVVVALGVPVQLSLLNAWGPQSFTHTAWAVLLSLGFVAAGIVLKVRSYLFGGAAALVMVTSYRTITYLATFWWLVLGLIGTVMLVIALTWERQRLLLSETQRRLKDSFENWR